MSAGVHMVQVAALWLLASAFWALVPIALGDGFLVFLLWQVLTGVTALFAWRFMFGDAAEGD